MNTSNEWEKRLREFRKTRATLDFSTPQDEQIVYCEDLVFYDDLEECLIESYQAGRQSVIDEMKHDQKKLLDGFSHPKDCEECKKK